MAKKIKIAFRRDPEDTCPTYWDYMAQNARGYERRLCAPMVAHFFRVKLADLADRMDLYVTDAPIEGAFVAEKKSGRYLDNEASHCQIFIGERGRKLGSYIFFTSFVNYLEKVFPGFITGEVRLYWWFEE